MSEETKPDFIQQALAKAKAAEAANPIPSTAVATQSTGAVAVAPQKLTMEAMSASAMAVDKWLKVSEHGLKLGESPLIVKPVLMSIDMTEGSGFVLKMAIKAGNPAQYAYTLNNADAVGGGTWPQAVARIQALEPAKSIRPYPAADLPFTLEETPEDVKGQKVGKVGDTIGYTTSTTNWKNWSAFHKECAEKGLLNQRVLVKVTAQERTGNGNTWGVLAFELVGPKDTE